MHEQELKYLYKPSYLGNKVASALIILIVCSVRDFRVDNVSAISKGNVADLRATLFLQVTL